jgi:parvulin-like peptidyl-prolyl isomerase
MLTWIREKFGTVLISGIIGLIAFVFVFFGIFSPKNTRGLSEGAVAGTVNGDPISLRDFNQSLQRRMEFYKQLAGGQLTDEQMRAFRLKKMVFEELVQRRLKLQEADRLGMMASDDEVKDSIREIPAFQKDGKFDLAAYKQVLEANNYSPSGFERLVREDQSVRRWDDYFKLRVHVADDEAKREFLSSHDKRNIRYVLLTNENGAKGLDVSKADIDKFLADPAKLNLAKSQFETHKENIYKGKTFDTAKESIAREILASEKIPEIQKINAKLADEIVGILDTGKGSEAKVDALLKPYGAQVKTTGMVSHEQPYIPGIGMAQELMTDAFADKSPIDPSQGGHAKKYTSAAWTMVAVVQESEKPDLSKFDASRDEVMRNLAMKKQRDLEQAWMTQVMAKAKIDENPSVVGESEGG